MDKARECFGDFRYGQPQAERDCDRCREMNGCQDLTDDERARADILFSRPGDVRPKPPAGALASQVGGNHYKDMPIQPVEFIHKNGIGFAEGAAIKYLCRWRTKNGIEDLKKARHFIDLLIEMERDDAKPQT